MEGFWGNARSVLGAVLVQASVQSIRHSVCGWCMCGVCVVGVCVVGVCVCVCVVGVCVVGVCVCVCGW